MTDGPSGTVVVDPDRERRIERAPDLVRSGRAR